MLASAVDIPLNADFEGGFAVDPAGVAANVARAAATGVAGLSIEDSTGDAAGPLYDFALAVERIAAARRARMTAGPDVILTARTEGFIAGAPDLAETIRRLNAFAEAGADCLYAPGLRNEADIAAVVSAVAPKPVNVLTPVGFPWRPWQAWGQAGERRRRAGARRLGRVSARGSRDRREGVFNEFAKAASGRELNALFASAT